MTLLNFTRNKINTFNRWADVPLLFFLLLVLNVSLGFKLLGVVLIYSVRPNFRFGFKTGRLPLFYVAMAVLSVAEAAMNVYRGSNYMALAGLVTGFWLMSMLIIHQVKLAIEKQGPQRVENSLSVFFVINALFSAINFIKIIAETGEVNPYTFDGLSFKYSASTGDYIKGVTADISTVNMILNAFGLFYYLYRNNYLLSIICYLVAVFTTSNLGNVILIVFFIYVLVSHKVLFHKGLVLCYISFMVIFIIKISPSNLNYINHTTKSLFHLKQRPIAVHFEDHSEKDKLILKYINTHNKTLKIDKENTDLTHRIMAERERQIKYKEQLQDTGFIGELYQTHSRYVKYYRQLYGNTANVNYSYYNHPGKYQAALQTFGFIQLNACNFLFGAGGGNFSSKLAYKAANLGISGKYINKFTYLSPEFKRNHLKLTLHYYLKSSTEHSIINFPNSVLNQLLGEYGITGLLLFLFFYLWFFIKKFKCLSFGKIVLPVCMLFLLTDYWFESLSIIIMCETMLFLDIALYKYKNPLI